MANMLDEVNDKASEGRDVRVINKQIPVKVGVGSKIFEIILWALVIIPGLVFLIIKIKTKNRLLALEQKIQGFASQVDNYLEQRVQVLQNLVGLVKSAVNLDTDTFSKIAELRSGKSKDESRNEIASEVSSLSRNINVQLEAYPELQAHGAIAQAMQQNMSLQREITSARDLYNDAVARWNQLIFQWPSYQIVAAKMGSTTRIPFSIDSETREKARSTFF
ncbi:LemA family protein [Mycoplasmopsis opalescens]|uniref:LemA family protein n=1 Tax=Mycoplasmopsis opalescens TaxID=114886 RepID=UPI0004A70714|nr:LemA family protein [Mycoplasmopsis opalescens]